MIAKFLLTATVVASCGVMLLTGQQPASSEVYTAAQAAAGRTAYESSCIACHTESLIAPVGAKYGDMQIPPLAGPAFLSRWGARTTTDLSKRIQEAIGGFPPKNLDNNTSLNIAAYVLQVNGAKPGTKDLTPATAAIVQSTTAPK